MTAQDTWRGNLADAAGNEMAVVLRMTPTGAQKPPPIPPPPPPLPPGVPANALWTWPTTAGDTQSRWANAGYYVASGNWSAGAGDQTPWARAYNDWGVVATEVAGGTAVVTYPNVNCSFDESSNETGLTYPLLSSLSALTSSYAEQSPVAAGIWEAAYDIWTGTLGTNPDGSVNYDNAWSNEIMIWVNNQGQTPAGSVVETWTDATGRVWQIWANASNKCITFELQGTQEPTGTVDLLAMLTKLVGENRLPAALVMTQVCFGWEICGTGGVPLPFACTGFSVTATAAAA